MKALLSRDWRQAALLGCLVLCWMTTAAQADNYCNVCGSCTTPECQLSIVSLDDSRLVIPNDLDILGNKLDLSYTGITTIGANAFGSMNLTNLKMLMLADMQISSIHPDAFTGLDTVESLYLANNRLSSIPDNALSHLSSLKELVLSSNPIQSLSAASFSGLSELLTLNMMSSGLTAFPVSALSQVPKLTSLSLTSTDDSVLSIPDNAFAPLSSLIWMSIGFPGLTTLSANTFTNLSSLTTLSINQAEFQYLPVDAFSKLPAIQSIYLYDTPTTLPAGIFQGLSDLTNILLIGSLTSIPAGLFNGLSSLRSINMFGLPLTTLPGGLFTGLSPLLLLTFGNTFASAPPPPSTYMTYQLQPCHPACGTCYGAGDASCCDSNCLSCNQTNRCLACYNGYQMIEGACVSTASMSAASASVSAASASVIAASIEAVKAAAAANQASSNTLPIAVGAAGGVVLVALIVLVALWRRRASLKLATSGHRIGMMNNTTYSNSDEEKFGMHYDGANKNAYETVDNNPTYEALNIPPPPLPVDRQFATSDISSSGANADSADVLYVEAHAAGRIQPSEPIASTVDYASITGTVALSTATNE
ncbi:hypothetical protein CAOG_05974 [Capsaspora owczarzaki ATCC 30864]|uniref:LRRNT domain-containing protein n=1 Tax=Capsaspora owczarzaki (strain ATCC 30864) TaxID=595528 RepID=A0A0D2UKA1_CAPO3|nr:hypothetical protein CAOG_05974 [Capsaspora owczarzaki ATCC 30864]KJE95526.1 hypothetical protein CAOG_005974 [Capsaspora owczarzaki ATCC 30864]|eukprot:XP_004345564.1 hypothetical protein CAOG_05974 [Capsaspora owczarzaki ATCC 30864]